MRSVELFAGCGGLALGIAQAGFAHDMVVERDGDSVRTLNENKKNKIKHICDWKIEESDTRDLSFRDLERVALLSGGPPCQPFSIGGKHLGPRDSRNMWPEAIRAVREIRPKAFVFENVRGLLRPDFANYLEYITLQLTYLDAVRLHCESWKQHLSRLRRRAKSNRREVTNYKVLVRAVNAADYGAAQVRHRVIVVGIATKFGSDWEFPRPTHSQEALAWEKYVTGEYWQRHGARPISEPNTKLEAFALERVLATDKKPNGRAWVTVRDAISDLPTPTTKEKIAGHWQHPGATSYPNHTGSYFDEPAKALKAGAHGVPGGENMLVNRSGSVRYFTVREMARLQGFPDDFLISGSWKAATRQLGNAVPTALGKALGKAVLNIIS
jgi:DNA (cytosine-5)-methyltransferase 1